MANEFLLRIRADGESEAVKKITAALSKISEPVEKAQARVAKLGTQGNANLQKLSKGFTGAADAARKVVDRIVEIIPGLTAIGGAASLAGVAALTSRFASFSFGLNKTSRLLGMNAQDLAAWHVAAKRAGVSAQEFDSAMASSQDSIRGASNGANPEAMLVLQKMGVQISRNRDGTVDYLKTQQDVLKALEAQRSVEGQRAAAAALGMSALLPIVQQGTWEADKARAARKGMVPTPDEISRAAEFHRNINDLQDSVEGLGNSIGSALIPVLDPLVRGLSNWLDGHRAQIADQIAAAVQRFSSWVSSIDWDGVTKKAKEFWDAIGGIKGVAIALAAITFAGPISGVLGLIGSLGRLSTVALPAAMSGLTALGLAGLGGAALFTIEKIKDSTDPGHFAGRNAGASNQTPLRAADTNASLAEGVRQGFREFFTTRTDQFHSRADSNAHGGTGGLDPLGIRSNNPLNMLDRGQEITYATPEEGIAAAARNLRRGYRGLSLAQIADKWTGGARTGNTPEQMANYVGLMSNGTGLGASDTPDLNDDSTVAALIKAQIRAENGKQPYSDDQVNTGVRQSVGGSSGASGSSSVGDDGGRAANLQSLQQQPVHITVNAPAGTRVEAHTADGGYLPTRVNYSLDGNMGAAP